MNKRVFVLLNAVLLFGLVGCGGGEDQQVKYLERAKQHLANENYEKAKVDARNVLQINPKNIEARVVLADIHFQDGELRPAFGGYSAAIQEQPDNVQANLGLAKIQTAVRDFDKAIEHCDVVLEKNPQNADALGYKALALVGLEKSEEGYALAKQALEIDAGNTAALGVTTQYLSLAGDYQGALDLLKVGQQQDPDEPRLSIMKLGVFQEMKDKEGMEKELLALTKQFPESEQYSTLLAGFYVRDSRPEKAEAAVRRFAEENPESFEAKQRLVVYLLQQESQQKAIDQAKAYIEADPQNTRINNTLAEIYLFTGDREKGVEALYDSIKLDPESVGAIEARTRLIGLYIEDKDLDQARKLIDDTLEIESENEIALMSRAAILLSKNDLKPAIADLRTVIKNNPSNTEALRILGQAQEAVGNRDLALDSYKKLLALGDRDQKTLASAARLAIQSEQYDEAEKYIRLSLEQQEQADNPGLITNLVRLLALKEDWTEADEFASRLVETESSSALGYYLKGAIDLQTGDSEDALSNFKKSIDVQPEAVESLAAYTTELSKQSGQEESIAFVRNHCREHSFANCHYVLGTLLAQNQDFSAAKAEMEKSLALDDKSVRTYRQLAKIEAVQKDQAAYRRVLERAIEATDNRGMKFDLATLDYLEKDYESASKIYESIIEAAGDSQAALAAKNNVAMIYADNIATEANLKRARALIADLQESENPAYLDTVGWVSYKSGDYEQAVTYVKAAVDKLGDQPLLRYHLGMAYYKAGDLQAAKEHLTVATSNPETPFDGFDEALETLQKI